MQLSSNLSILRAQTEMLDEDHWVSNVVVQYEDHTERLLFALPSGYDPREDAGWFAQSLLIESLKELTD